MLRLPVRPSAELEPATIDAARRGESWAQALVVEHYATPVWSLVCRILGRAGRRSVAEDTTQDALVAALRSISRFEGDGRTGLTSWVLTIAARTAIDTLRKHREVATLEDDAAESPDRPDRSAERSALGRAIERAVEQLSPEIRAAFVLRAYYELEYAEIAEALAVDIGTVKSRLWRARAALKSSLAEVRRER
ncbi:MAG TPA: sigma-70 family RNA polymerase sigma factor [Nannocystaceae bacterium]|nr:sigma-70 family RNA polymerase sigma factor [Nannocystaceae bacterium]